MSSVLKKADIVICSYLGDSKELQERRFKYHLEQREVLNDKFPKQRIVSLCSGYPKTKRDYLDSIWSAVFFDNKLPKWRKHNLLFKLLYQSKKPKAQLLLDDDVIPCDLKGMVDPVSWLIDMIHHPRKMPAPCVYFSTKGLMADIYYNSRDAVPVVCPAMPVGWATLVRNDLGVLFDISDVWGGELNDVALTEDAIFRVKCAAKGQLVVKHQGVFFQTFQNIAKDNNSSWYADREARRICVDETRKAVRRKWPWLFVNNLKQVRPIWTARGPNIRRLYRIGGLVHTEYGPLPVPDVLKADYEAYTKPRQTLADL